MSKRRDELRGSGIERGGEVAAEEEGVRINPAGRRAR